VSYRRPFAATLTDRELQILRAVATGDPYKVTAADLGRSEKTIKYLWAEILRKLGAVSRTHAVALMDDYRPGWRPMLRLPEVVG